MADIVRLDERRKRPLDTPRIVYDAPIEFPFTTDEPPVQYVAPEPAEDPLSPSRRGRIPSTMCIAGFMVTGFAATGLIYGTMIYLVIGTFPYALHFSLGLAAGLALIAGGIFVHLHD